MKRRNVIILALGGLAALTGAECEGGGSSKDDPFPAPARTRGADEPPDPYTVNDDLPGVYVIALSAWIEPQYGPIRVSASATDLNTGSSTTLTDSPFDATGKTGLTVAAGKQWQYTLAYPEGHRAEINIHVQASRPGSTKGYIAARPTERNRGGKRTESFSGTAGLSLHTIAE